MGSEILPRRVLATLLLQPHLTLPVATCRGWRTLRVTKGFSCPSLIRYLGKRNRPSHGGCGYSRG